MRYTIIFLIWLWLPQWAWSQYGGGVGDGLDHSGFIQLSLDGVPAGIQPLYAGGNGDGFDHLTTTSGLKGQEAVAIYGGGSGDGFDQLSFASSIDGFDVSALYLGGDGDGFDVLAEVVSLNGVEVAGLFGGGDGDGFDRLSYSSSISGIDAAGLYGGGAGDGFDRLSISTGLMGFMPTSLYGGGDGDGFDRLSYSSSLSGIDAAALYGGGAGDGFDRGTINGMLPLPLTLISFEAFPKDNYVLLRWVTEDEIATDFFTIEKTKDGRLFSWVGETDAAGFSEPSEQIYYELKDLEPYQGLSYYRLKTTDFDGTISLSHLVSVHFADNEDWNFSLFPNPNTGKHFSISLVGETKGARMLVEIYDTQGRLLLQDYLDSALRDSQRFDLQDRLPSGSYLIRVVHPDRGQQSKILIIGRG